jgi:hypothetical protein
MPFQSFSGFSLSELIEVAESPVNTTDVPTFSIETSPTESSPEFTESDSRAIVGEIDACSSGGEIEFIAGETDAVLIEIEEPEESSEREPESVVNETVPPRVLTPVPRVEVLRERTATRPPPSPPEG